MMGEPVQEPMAVGERNKSHLETLRRVIEFTKVADTKSAPLLALQTTLAGITVTQAPKIGSLLEEGNACATRVAALLLLAAYAVPAVASWGWAAWVYMPRARKTGTSLIYFEDIRHMDKAEFVSCSKTLTDEVLEENLIDQVYRVSTLASDKFRWVRRSIQCGAVALVAWIVLVAWAQL